ncbi:hypothetical protein ACWIG5_31265 [Streptomyces lydicus]
MIGWEAMAWHTAQWWRFQWEITELVAVTSARNQHDGWCDWLLWTQAGADSLSGRALGAGTYGFAVTEQRPVEPPAK